MVSKDLSSIQISSPKLVTVLLTVNTSNSYSLSWTWTTHGPIKSMAHSSNGMDWTLCSGRSPYPFPSNLFLDNSHSWSCQWIFSSHDYDISDLSVCKASSFQDDLWLDDTTLLWVLLIPLIVLFSNWTDCHLAWCSTKHLQPDQRS